jgi:hypothetical protein
MICENPTCHCQSEVGVVRDGREVCSEFCRPNSANLSELCHCGHVGCLPFEETERMRPEAPRW